MSATAAPSAAPPARGVRALAHTVLALLWLLALAFVAHGWAVVYLWPREQLPRTVPGWLDLLHPGYWSTAEWLRAQGYTKLCTLPYESANARQQRLIELLYPIELEDREPTAFVAGDVAVLPRGFALTQATEQLFAAGELMVVRIR